MPKACTTKPPIRRFKSQRGRPRQSIISSSGDTSDSGTPELILKRAQSLTSEPIDLCLSRGHINEEEHRAALHLRWLYTLRHGAPGISAFDLLRGQGHSIEASADPAWRSAREREYLQAMALLKRSRSEQAVLSCILYHEMPEFLIPSTSTRLSQHYELERKARQALHFSDALRQLSSLFRSTQNHPQKSELSSFLHTHQKPQR